MRLLGLRATLETIRYDLVYLKSALAEDTPPDIAALAPPIEALHVEWRAERELFESAEDADVIMAAKRSKKDKKLDKTVLSLGGVARALDSNIYLQLFPKLSPSDTARAALGVETVEVQRIVGELGELPADNALRLEYHSVLATDLDLLRAAMKQREEVGVALMLARSRLDKFKLKVDRMRVETHGKLQAILGSRSEADAFFRPTTRSPGEEAVSGATEIAPAAKPEPVPA